MRSARLHAMLVLLASARAAEFRALWPAADGFDDHGRGPGGGEEGSKTWFDGLTKVGGAQGSNPGGSYVDAQGQRWYVKNYKDPSQAAGEHISNEIYRAVGAKVPETVLSGNRIASKWLPDAGKTLGDSGGPLKNAAASDKVLDHFAADVFVMNWDAVGTGHDNVLASTKGVTRVDQGGTLLHRAQGELKPEGLLNGLGEWHSLREQNHYYAQVFKAAKVDSADALGSRAVKQINDIVAARPAAGWRAFAAKAAPSAPPAYLDRVGKMLEARQSLLEAKRDSLKKLKSLEFNEDQHPRDEKGKFSEADGGGGTGEKEKKVKAAPATKDQIAKAVQLKKEGHSYAHIQVHTGLNPKQAATIVHKANKAEAAVKAKMNPAGNLHGKVAELDPIVGPGGTLVYPQHDGSVQDYAGKTITPAPTSTTTPAPTSTTTPASGAKNYIYTGKDGKQYEWKEKTKDNSPNLSKDNKGKYAYFHNGIQVSGAHDKTEATAAVKTINQGKGPDYVAPAPATPAVKEFYAKHEPGAAPAAAHPWPLSNSTVRQIGSSTPVVLEAAGTKWVNSLTAGERGAIKSYTGSSYSHINFELYENGVMSDSAKKIASALDKSPTPPPPDLVWRGVNHSGAAAFAAKLATGDKIRLDGFQSSSIKPEFAHSWGGGKTIFEIKPAKGGYIKPVSGHKTEYEYLLPHGSEYAVRGIAKVSLNGNLTNVIQLEMLK